MRRVSDAIDEPLALGVVAWSSNVYVAPEHRGRGHAATLLAHALRQYRRARIRPYLYCHADNAVALHAYRRAGFCRTNDGPYVKLALPAPADV